MLRHFSRELCNLVDLYAVMPSASFPKADVERLAALADEFANRAAARNETCVSPDAAQLLATLIETSDQIADGADTHVETRLDALATGLKAFMLRHRVLVSEDGPRFR